MIRYRGMTSFTKYSSRGEPFTVYREEPQMQRIDNRFLDCSVYLYPTEEHANEGKNVGASGFLVAMPAAGNGWLLGGICPTPGYHHLYVVSNRHNIRPKSGRPKSVVRLNTHDGNTSVIPARDDEWICSDEHDLAVLPISYRKYYKYLAIGSESFLTKEAATSHDVGIGDEVFMVGRFVNNEGKQQNLPSARFGHISMMPSESEPLGHSSNPSGSQVSFVVEVLSIPGYSGSPVFVRPSPLPVPKVPASTSASNTNIGKLSVFPIDYESSPGLAVRRPTTWLHGGPWLLGVEWGSIHNYDPDENKYFTGMSGVVPAWYLRELLDSDILVMQRRREQEIEKERTEGAGTTET